MPLSCYLAEITIFESCVSPKEKATLATLTTDTNFGQVLNFLISYTFFFSFY